MNLEMVMSDVVAKARDLVALLHDGGSPTVQLVRELLAHHDATAARHALEMACERGMAGPWELQGWTTDGKLWVHAGDGEPWCPCCTTSHCAPP